MMFKHFSVYSTVLIDLLYFIKKGDMIMHSYDKAWYVCCTNWNQISVGLVLAFFTDIQQKS